MMRSPFWHAAALLLCTLVTTWGASPAHSAPVTETRGRLEVNWATLRVRFYGEVQPDADGLKTAEKRAWQDGLNYAMDAVRDLNVSANEPLVTDPERLAEDAREAARQVASSTYSYNTTYFGNGSVRVHLESSLPKALDTTSLRFRQREALEPTMLQRTGLVLEADQAAKPRPTYQVVDEAGNVLFDVKDMAANGYRKNLMGRWYRRPTASELKDAVGTNPLRLKAKVVGERFVVNREEWDNATNGHQSLLVNGLLAIALP